MCGICGVVGAGTCGAVDIVSQVQSMTETLRHRGPDAEDTATTDEAMFGHTRLAILDLDKRSNQPFGYRDATLVYNGEIWNYMGLKAELEFLGHKFRTTGDTEVLAALLDEWGMDALPKIEGMFAFAWASPSGEVWLARDRYGKIPLHVVSLGPETFGFASELKALRSIGAAGQAKAVPAGEAWRMVPAPAQRLPWAALRVPKLSDDGTAVAATKVHAALDMAVRGRMISDVPICTLLSGGLDSTFITALLAQYHPDVTAFHAVFAEKSTDREMAHLVADHLGIKLIEVPVEPPTLETLAETIDIVETPSKTQVEIALACIPLAAAIREHGFKVVFSGDGSDELWGSYGFSQMERRLRDDRGWAVYRTDLFAKQQDLNFVRANKAYMSAGVEVRIPFTDRRLVEYALSLRSRTILGDNGRKSMKRVLELAAEHSGLLPEKVIRRAKVAFQVGTGLRDAAGERLDTYQRSAREFYREEFARLYGRAGGA